jgi:hypothetical protein
LPSVDLQQPLVIALENARGFWTAAKIETSPHYNPTLLLEWRVLL